MQTRSLVPSAVLVSSLSYLSPSVVVEYLSLFDANVDRLERRALAWTINAHAVFEAKHRAVMRAHQQFSVVGPERVRLVVQRNGEVRAQVAVSPRVFAAAQDHDARGKPRIP